MKKIMLLFGTRPEAVKMCPLVTELKTRSGIETVVCVSGQHRQMLTGVLSSFGVTADRNMRVMKNSQTLSSLFAAVLTGTQKALADFHPDVVAVHGDTITAFAGALACFFSGVPVAHVEAGLRTGDMRSPFPEELDRRAIALMASYNFSPTGQAAGNLIREGAAPERVWVTGNTVIDALRYTVNENYTHPELEWASGAPLVLVTAHRRESLGDTMRGMLRAVRRVALERPFVRILFPLHMNPLVRKAAEEILGDLPSVHLTGPLEVRDFHNILARARIVLTDSGGVQEEAAALGKPTLVMRDETERPEGVDAGVLRAVGTDENRIYLNFMKLLDDPQEYSSMARPCDSYGDGFACRRIADILAI